MAVVGEVAVDARGADALCGRVGRTGVAGRLRCEEGGRDGVDEAVLVEDEEE